MPCLVTSSPNTISVFTRPLSMASAIFGKLEPRTAGAIPIRRAPVLFGFRSAFRSKRSPSPERGTESVSALTFRASLLNSLGQQRAFVGVVANLGLEHYLTSWMFTFDLRYSAFLNGPAAIGLVIGFAKIGP